MVFYGSESLVLGCTSHIVPLFNQFWASGYAHHEKMLTGVSQQAAEPVNFQGFNDGVVHEMSLRPAPV